MKTRLARRPLIERTPRVHVRSLRDAGLLPGIEAVRLRVGDALAEQVRILWRETPFGGQRAYFVCPACGSGAMILYSRPHLACRKCHGLAYHTENLTKLWRKNEKLDKLQKLDGCDMSRFPRPIPPKPKWQRWHSHLALRRAIEAADRDFAAAYLGSRHGRWPGLSRMKVR